MSTRGTITSIFIGPFTWHCYHELMDNTARLQLSWGVHDSYAFYLGPYSGGLRNGRIPWWLRTIGRDRHAEEISALRKIAALMRRS